MGLAIRKQCVQGDEGQNLRWGEECLVDGKLSRFGFFFGFFCHREDKERRLLGTSAANKAYKHFKQCAAM